MAGTSGAAGESAPAAGNGGGAGQGGAGGEMGGGGAPEPMGAQDPDCDFNGIWIADQITVSLAQGFPLPQYSNNWYYLEIKQEGTAVEVTKHMDCGIEVLGTVTVTISPQTLEALLTANAQNGRKGTLSKQGDKCAFEMEHFWSIRGADAAPYLPGGIRNSNDSIAQAQSAKPLPTAAMPDGAVDTEKDGKLGVAFQVAGIASGTRNSVQRDWTRWFTAPGYEITPSTDWTSDLKVRSDFDNEESVLDPSSGLLAAGSMPDGSSKHILKLRFLGRDKSDARVSAIVKGKDTDTCFAIQDALPAQQQL